MTDRSHISKGDFPAVSDAFSYFGGHRWLCACFSRPSTIYLQCFLGLSDVLTHVSQTSFIYQTFFFSYFAVLCARVDTSEWCCLLTHSEPHCRGDLAEPYHASDCSLPHCFSVCAEPCCSSSCLVPSHSVDHSKPSFPLTIWSCPSH